MNTMYLRQAYYYYYYYYYLGIYSERTAHGANVLRS